jgi:hypothetical protein
MKFSAFQVSKGAPDSPVEDHSYCSGLPVFYRRWLVFVTVQQV